MIKKIIHPSRISLPFKHLIAIGFFLIVTIIITWPTAIRMKSVIYGAPGDAQATYWTLWWKESAQQSSVNPDQSNLINYPNGFDFSIGQKFISYELLGAKLADWLGPAVAYNLMVIGFLWLAQLAMYFLIYLPTGSLRAGIFGGLAFGLSPYLLAHSQHHLGLITIFWLPLIILVLLRTVNRPDVSTILLGILAISVFSSDHFYYGIFLVIVLAVAVILGFIFFGPKRAWPILAVALLAAVITFGLNYRVVTPLVTRDQNSMVVATTTRSSEELKTYSAQAAGYLLPPADQPFLGAFTRPIHAARIAAAGTNSAEATLYLGYGLTLLALVGIWLLIRNSRSWPAEVKFLGWLGLIVAVIGLYFSFGRPGQWLWPVMPFLRVYSRFGLLVNFGLVILASLAVWQLAKKWAVVAVIAILVVLFEFAPRLPAPTLAVSPDSLPAVYQYLTALPGTPVIAEYPYLSSEDPVSYQYLRFQTIHHLPLIYGAPVGSAADKRREEMLSLTDPATITKLIDDQANYLIVHEALFRDPVQVKKYPVEYQEGRIPKITDPRIQYIARFGNDILYRINR